MSLIKMKQEPGRKIKPKTGTKPRLYPGLNLGQIQG